MKLAAMRALFPPHIWQRGVEYYEAGRVLSITRDRAQITAEVAGTEQYYVSIRLDEAGEEPLDYDCSCPYAESGQACKHLAAVLCALEHPEREPAEPPVEDIPQVVDRLSPEQMRRLLIRLAQGNAAIAGKLRREAAPVQDIRADWEAELAAIADEFEDASGFIDYDNAYEYCISLQELIEDRLPLLLDTQRLSDAFELVCGVFEAAAQQEMDDSDGGLSMLAAVCEDAWSSILERSDPDAQRAMLPWFLAAYDQRDARSLVGSYLFRAPWDRSLTNERLAQLDRLIATCEKSERNPYRLSELVLHRAELMQCAGRSAAEQAAYLESYRALPEVRLALIDRAQSGGDLSAAIALLKESKARDAKAPGLVARYSRQLIALYEAQDDPAAVQEELSDYLSSFRQIDLEYVQKMKALLSDDAWRSYRAGLLQMPTMRDVLCPLLLEEKMYDELMAVIERRKSIPLLKSYETVLKKAFPQRCVAVYERHLRSVMATATDRKAYREAVRVLKDLRKYPDAKPLAQQIAEQWKSTYPRRTSMHDELKKAGF